MNNEKPSSSSTGHSEEADLNGNQPLPAYQKLANAVLAFYKDPKTQPRWVQASEPLPANVPLYLQYVAHRINQMNLVSDTTKSASRNKDEESSHNDDEELINAALFFVRRVLLANGANHYRVLGLKVNASLDQIQKNYRNLRRLYWDQKKPGQDQTVVMRISEAYVVLREPQTKQEYNKQIQRYTYRGSDGGFNESMRPEKRGNESSESSKKSLKVKGLLMLCGLLAIIVGGIWYSQQEDESVLEELVTAMPIVEEISDETVTLIQNDNPVPNETDNIDATEPALDESSNDSLIQRIEEFVDAPLVVAENLLEEQSQEETPTHQGITPVEQSELTFIDQQKQNTDFIEITQLIAQAERQFEGTRLTKPANDNAYDTYLTILEKDPGNPFAISGLQRIAEKYMGMAVYRLQNERYLDALNMVRRGLDVVPAYKPLLDLENQINQKMQPVLLESEIPDNSELNSDLFSAEVEEQLFDENPEPAVVDRLETPALEVLITEQEEVEEQLFDENLEPAVVDRLETPAPEVLITEPELESESQSDLNSDTTLSNDLKAAELERLLNDFVSLYEKGELEPFLDLFSEDVNTNNRTSKTGLRKDYQSLFDSTSKRLIRLKSVRWSIEPKEAIGEGDFTLTIVKKGTVRPRSFEGSLTFQVVKADQIVITGLYHSQKKLGQ
ncbi:hypothetical protein MNBD_GAMMA16-1550 [hydrothermal vent metagenome]|uniref:J domain-containing protein n=1 Tax=hydrothermal vent metagenome TaxID=652676 RepID=A0A3B0YWA3_9ZZZZ